MEGTSTQPNVHGGVLECSICLGPPRSPVVTPCGHLFCWPCLYRWLCDQRKPCPVCRVMLWKEVITPIYGSHEEDSKAGQEDSKEGGESGAIPPRPNPPSTSTSTSTAVRMSSTASDRAITRGRVRVLSQLADQISRDREELRLALEVERAYGNALRAEIRLLRTTVADLARWKCQLEVNEIIRRQQARLDSLRAHYAPH